MTVTTLVAYLPTRMKPRAERGREGRVSAKGIPCLYGATSPETAMAEVKPWLGAYVSVGLFETVRDLTIVDCSKYHAKHPLDFLLNQPLDDSHTPSPQEIDEAVWTHIDHAFSEPVTESDDLPDYIPTQILAELFKAQKYDGLAYKSKLTDGYNVAFFDPGVAKQVYGSLHKVEAVRFQFGAAEDEFWLDDRGVPFRQEITDVRPVPR